MTTRRYVTCGVLCCGTMSCHLVSNTAWRRYARLRVLWRDVDHLATRRDEVLCHGTGIPQAPAVKEDLDIIWVTVISNGNFNMPLGISDITVVRFTIHTVDHNTYCYPGCCDIRIDKHGALALLSPFLRIL